MTALRRRLGRWPVRRRQASDPWTGYLDHVEPALAAGPRVHRFAEVPMLGAPDRTPPPVAVWIDGPGEDGGSLAALNASTRAPSAILRGDLGTALSSTRAPWMLLLRNGDVPAPLALERLAQATALAPDATVITCDEDELDAGGRRRVPQFRPGPSPDRWLAVDDSGTLILVAREAALEQLPRLEPAPGWRHELALRLAGARSERHAHVPLLLCHRRTPAPAAMSPEAVERVLGTWGTRAPVTVEGAARRVHRRVAGEPHVEVIVCFRDRPELLARCVESLLAHTEYERLSVTLVDNGSVEAQTERVLARLAARPRVRVLRDPRPFNFSALNNRAAASSEAEVIVLLNNDTEVTACGWLEPLLAEALRSEVGAVAPLLHYPDGTVQHAGAALGLHGYAGHPFAGLASDASTPFGRPAQGTRNWMAVTAACMVIERAKFMRVGGFDERFVVAGNDVDLCLRLTAAGHRSLCVSWSRLLHDESRSRGSHIDPGDFAASERSYGAFRTVGDPFYSPSLTLERTDCSVRSA